MTRKRHPSRATHNTSTLHTCNTNCNTATQPKCTCACEGSGHQYTLAEMAIRYPNGHLDIMLSEGHKKKKVSFPMFLQRCFMTMNEPLTVHAA